MGKSDPPQYVTPAPDPLYLQLQEQAKKDQTAALQDRASLDTASIMARYGSQLSLAGGASQTTAAAAPSIAPIAHAQAGPGGTGWLASAFGTDGTMDIAKMLMGGAKS